MKTAVVLFNLGGPDSQEAVEPFLFNLFFDPAIIWLPKPLRYILAKIISSKRAPKTKKIYQSIGNKSPLLELTHQQVELLEQRLSTEGKDYKCFVSMRYWHPFSQEVLPEVVAYRPDEIILVPLYPQFSTTTTASSINDWKNITKKAGLNIPQKIMGCYPFETSFIRAHVDLILKTIYSIKDKENIRLIFSAHGLPEKVIAQGDPYQWQVEQTVAHTVSALSKQLNCDRLDFVISYQSRVGPLAWIGPSTEEEIRRAGNDKKTIVLVPIAFVSEHSETLVELDIEYAHLASTAGVTKYLRVPALGTHPDFIASLVNLCREVEKLENGTITNSENIRICPANFSQCLCFPQ